MPAVTENILIEVVMIPILPALKPLTIKDRISVIYIKKGNLDVIDGAFIVVDKTGVRTHIPIGTVACLMGRVSPLFTAQAGMNPFFMRDHPRAPVLPGRARIETICGRSKLTEPAKFMDAKRESGMARS